MKNQLLLAAALPILWILALHHSLTGAESRVALVIGNGAYENGSPLRNPVTDAKDIAGSLKRCQFDLIGGQALVDVSHEEMEQGISKFRKAAQEADVALFFFAGHGLEMDGTNYLVPTDAVVEEEYQVKHRTVSLTEVMDSMAGSRGSLKIIILDCCRDNPLGRAWGRRLSRGLSAIDDTPDGTIILFSAGPGKVASDGEGRNSPFTAVLKEAILEENAEIETVFKKVGSRVQEDTGSQRPWMNSNYYQSFVFAKASTPPSTVPSQKAAGRDPATYWNSVEALFSEAFELERKGDLDAAIDKMTELIETEERVPRLLQGWQFLLKQGGRDLSSYEGRFRRSRSEVLSSAAYDGNDPEMHFVVSGWLLFQSEDYEIEIDSAEREKLRKRAFEHAVKASNLAPGVAEFRYHLAVCRGVEDTESFRKDLNETIRLNPSHWTAWTDLVGSSITYDKDTFAPTGISPEGVGWMEELERQSFPLLEPLAFVATEYLSPETAPLIEPIVKKRLARAPQDPLILSLLDDVVAAKRP
ncbi:MAG: caspase family protein [Verrucomicrobiae bacterium]|nr:caspase family protein [Verrucomicrobiae bacterium]